MQDNRETNADDGLGGFEELDPVSAVSDLSNLPDAEWSPTKTLMGQGPGSAQEAFDSLEAGAHQQPAQPYQPTESFLPPAPSGAAEGGHLVEPYAAYEAGGAVPYSAQPDAVYGQSQASAAVAHFDLDGPDEPQDSEVTLQVEGTALEPMDVPGDLPVNWDVNEDLTTSHYSSARAQALNPAATMLSQEDIVGDEPLDVGPGSLVPTGNPSPFPSQAPAPFASSGPNGTAPMNLAVPAHGLGAPAPSSAPSVPSHTSAPPPPPVVGSGPPLDVAVDIAPAPLPQQPLVQVAAPYTASLNSTPATLPSLPPPPSVGPERVDFGYREANRRRGGFMGSRIGLLLAVLLLCGVSLWVAYALMGVGTGTVQVATTPTDAALQLDGKAVASGDASPFVLTLAAGKPHQLVVSKDGFAPRTITIEADAGETKVIERIALEAVPPAETGFAISSEPAGAEILVDGTPTGQVTPARVTGVSAGQHRIALVPPEGFARLEMDVSVATGAVTAVPPATLAAAPGADADGAAEGTGDDKLVDRAEAEYDKRIAQKTAGIKARARRAERAEAAADRRARRNSREREPVVRMKPAASRAAKSGTGTLRVNSRPWAQVTLNGRSLGNTPILNQEVPAGTHTLKLHNPTMGLSQTLKVRVPAGKTVTKRITLVP